MNAGGIKTAIVIGGGIAGPVAAMALRRAGIEAAVYEAHATAAYGVGAMLTLQPNGVNALKTIGADAAIEAIGQPVPGVVMTDGAGHPVSEFRGFPELPQPLAMPRAALFRALAEQAASRGLRLEYGKRLVGVEQGTDTVAALFDDGSTATADVLIGADGIRSSVRTLIDPDAPGPEYQGVQSFGGIVAPGTVPTEPGSMYFAFGRVFLGYWALPDSRIAWFASLPSAEPWTAAQVAQTPATEWLERLRALYAGHVPGEQLLARTDPADLMKVGPMERMPSVPHWYRGRMVLVGDAAHAPSTSSGQGASLAIESAVELARCLRDVPGHAKAFAAYEGLRRARVELIGGAAVQTNKAKAGGGRPALPNPEQMFAPVHRFRIDWAETVRPPESSVL